MIDKLEEPLAPAFHLKGHLSNHVTRLRATVAAVGGRVQRVQRVQREGVVVADRGLVVDKAFSVCLWNPFSGSKIPLNLRLGLFTIGFQSRIVCHFLARRIKPGIIESILIALFGLLYAKLFLRWTKREHEAFDWNEPKGKILSFATGFFTGF